MFHNLFNYFSVGKCPITDNDGNLENKPDNKEQLYTELPKKKDTNKEYYKEYRAKHSNKIKCACGVEVKEYHITHHYKTNKHLRFMQKQDKQDTILVNANKPNLIKCICGSEIQQKELPRHNKTQKHINYLKNQEQNKDGVNINISVNTTNNTTKNISSKEDTRKIIKCPCGSNILEHNVSIHYVSKKHINFVKTMLDANKQPIG